ncbi:MAG: HDIG domain-containing protein, partial [Bacteroidota bacterium]|nr:HDIG domain-containing protein [Bacteroidota bacterium]
LFFMFLVGGVVTMYVFKYFNRGWRQFLTALIAFLTVLTVYMGFRFFLGDEQNILQVVLMLFIGSFLSVAGYPLIYLFEILFNLVSGSRLMELCDTNNKLLRELSEKAPGTFQHSLQVMNMADAACREIDADVLLVRAGALYHDIGKMANPRCFIENEGQFPGMKPYHEGMDPHESAVQILRHVPDGLVMAEKHHLPHIVKEFIRTHHGTSCTRYFYTQYLNAGGSPDNMADFCYDGAKPYTREQTVLMICDSIEAASRTMKEYTPEACDELVRRIVQGKISEGQFTESPLSIRDLDLLQHFLAKYLSQMYHGRIEYPKLNRNAARTVSRGR